MEPCFYCDQPVTDDNYGMCAHFADGSALVCRSCAPTKQRELDQWNAGVLALLLVASFLFWGKTDEVPRPSYLVTIALMLGYILYVTGKSVYRLVRNDYEEQFALKQQ